MQTQRLQFEPGQANAGGGKDNPQQHHLNGKWQPTLDSGFFVRHGKLTGTEMLKTITED